MKVGVLGTGVAGRTLGMGFVAHGHEVMIGSRDPESDKLREWLANNPYRASAGSFADAARFGEIVVLATLWSGTENAIRLAEPANLEGKVVIDVTNPLIFVPNRLPRLAIGLTDSGGEQVQRWLPASRVVKAFNTVGNQNMVDPRFEDGPPTMFICGNDVSSKTMVESICTELGFEATDCGGIEAARELEPMVILFVRIGLASGSWTHAFKLLRR